jgi:hypothetical protein
MSFNRSPCRRHALRIARRQRAQTNGMHVRHESARLFALYDCDLFYIRIRSMMCLRVYMRVKINCMNEHVYRRKRSRKELECFYISIGIYAMCCLMCANVRFVVVQLYFSRCDVHWCWKVCGYKMFWSYVVARLPSRFGMQTCCVV